MLLKDNNNKEHGIDVFKDKRFVSVQVSTKKSKPKSFEQTFVLRTMEFSFNHKRKNSSSKYKHDSSYEFSSYGEISEEDRDLDLQYYERVDNWVKSVVELTSTGVLETPALLVSDNDDLGLKKTYTSPRNQIKEKVDFSSMKELTFTKYGEFIEKFDKFAMKKNGMSRTYSSKSTFFTALNGTLPPQLKKLIEVYDTFISKRSNK
ncbi:uncharacterized protein LOC126894437 [Daktulosphaira vitifoliae]|uniref:uncharacterized protein LOC126894437 n=1 Tax=Daktulosphaira vitifoliae TaxID=58002 RepID=UPI0021AA7B9F|nr:uncharacterized protein LOC126894437 [Daktulosphaira vitifoliae]